jgi:formylglycine-generating enzyme required for sulfatase activity
MSGNVWEWTDSWWDQGPGKRAVRGGSWVSDEESARCAACNSILPDASLDFLGFRVVVVEWTGG